MMPHQVRTNTKLAIILNRYRGDEFTAMWKAKAKVVSKHTQRFRIMWERLSEGDATLPLFDNDYEPKSIAELFTPELPQSIEIEQPNLTSQTNEVRLCDQSLALWKRTKAPLRGVPHKNGRPSIEELKVAFWAEELQERSYRRKQ